MKAIAKCLYAQVKMGKSWRVGIDESTKTSLIKTGLYKVIRNPTYLGLYILNTGVWMIWPTWTIFILNLFFIYTLEIQVRCEWDFLEKTHGKIIWSIKINKEIHPVYILNLMSVARLI